MKVYVLINSNEEGYNFKGVFDTREAADAACCRINDAGRKEMADLYADPVERKRMVDFYDRWDSTEVFEWEMNTAQEPMQEEPDQR